MRAHTRLPLLNIKKMSSPALSEPYSDQHTTTAALSSNSTSDQQTSPENLTAEPDLEPVKVRRKPIPSKGHKKSRRGCFNCKRRRVKCSEQLPRCAHCSRMGVNCEYPAAPSRNSSPHPGAPLRSTPMALGLEDLRFFHHFLFKAYPPVPYGSQATWQSLASMVHEVICAWPTALWCSQQASGKACR